MTCDQTSPEQPRTSPLPRRSVLAGGLATGAGGAALALAGPAAAAGPAGTGDAAAKPGNRVFRHGVASGDPLPGAVVLWTRVTPTPASRPGSGRGPKAEVTWEVATDRRFRRVVRRGKVSTGPWRDHTVKVDATGLDPETWYYYRFRHGRALSPVGRTRTAPAPNALPENLRFGVTSCANLQAGWFTAYRGLAQRDDLHAVLHLGDYLYEYPSGGYGYGSADQVIRPHEPEHEIVTLADYRQRHAQYKSDPDLQALHAKYPFIVVWDDHESTNDAWRDGAENHQPEAEGEWAARRNVAHRAYDEWMPVRLSGTAKLGDGTALFRRLRFGQLAELSLLDLRTYRDQQVAVPLLDPAVSDPDRTITGRRQMKWLKDSLDNRRAQWKLVGNPVMIAPVTFAALPKDLIRPVNDTVGLLPADGLPYNVDQWDGYTDDRRELFEHIRDRGVQDAVFLTGDIHSGWACELPYDNATYPIGDSAGVELVCTSVTSNNLKDILSAPPRTASLAVEAIIQANNRHVRYLNFDDHGFSVLDLTAQRAQMDWFVIGDRKSPDLTVSHTASWATATGTGKLTRVQDPVGA
ncbi:alkaline phosphatase D family protein [Nocardioides ferulae]|uniref:alkaline phosphatase D family protein n=1 Tax=Nocardioides ferulae TaxID=2340821 RepID=UPI001F0BE90A|nr:alkaline phosphatase D family protein [Nocardioides ferulae]